jgi:hypothetical protein
MRLVLSACGGDGGEAGARGSGVAFGASKEEYQDARADMEPIELEAQTLAPFDATNGRPHPSLVPVGQDGSGVGPAHRRRLRARELADARTSVSTNEERTPAREFGTQRPAREPGVNDGGERSRFRRLEIDPWVFSSLRWWPRGRSRDLGSSAGRSRPSRPSAERKAAPERDPGGGAGGGPVSEPTAPG